MTLDNQKLLMYWLYGLALVLAFVLYKFITSVYDLVTAMFMQGLLLSENTVESAAAILALGITAAAAEYVRRNNTTNRFGIEVVGELRRVAWPNWKEVRGTTLVVLGVTIVVSFILFIMDKVYDGLMAILYGLI